MTSSPSEKTARPWRRGAVALIPLAAAFLIWSWTKPPPAPVTAASAPPGPSPAESAAALGEEDGDLRFLAPSTELPPVMEESVLKASLAALKAHGADLSRPVPSRHRIICGDRAAAARVAEWARAHGFSPGEPISYNSHGGVERLMVDLVSEQMPEPAAILEEGRAVLAGMSGIDGALYHTWMSAAPPR